MYYATNGVICATCTKFAKKILHINCAKTIAN